MVRHRGNRRIVPRSRRTATADRFAAPGRRGIAGEAVRAPAAPEHAVGPIAAGLARRARRATRLRASRACPQPLRWPDPRPAPRASPATFPAIPAARAQLHARAQSRIRNLRASAPAVPASSSSPGAVGPAPATRLRRRRISKRCRDGEHPRTFALGQVPAGEERFVPGLRQLLIGKLAGLAVGLQKGRPRAVSFEQLLDFRPFRLDLGMAAQADKLVPGQSQRAGIAGRLADQRQQGVTGLVLFPPEAHFRFKLCRAGAARQQRSMLVPDGDQASPRLLAPRIVPVGSTAATCGRRLRQRPPRRALGIIAKELRFGTAAASRPRRPPRRLAAVRSNA